MNKIHFEKLTPINDVKLEIYEDAFNFVFDNDDIKNIAISGAYGAGKSSVIESYKNRHKEIEFLNISLANFDEINQQNLEDGMNENLNKDDEVKIKSNKKSTKDKVNNVKESVLEGKILNQLIHKIDSSKIPQTNFKVKQKISNRNIIKLTLLSLIYILSAFYMYFYSIWCNYVTGLEKIKIFAFLKYTTNWVGLLISGLILSILSGKFIFNLIKFEKNRNIIKRFKFQGNEIEIFEKSDESYFDKYLNEVLYIFDNSNVDAIVFEDMDRYNVNQIFQRLREINNLINSRRIKESNRFLKIVPKFIWDLHLIHTMKKSKPLKFLYLLRDDIFISKDRTKFFDFIIPVVPVIDNSNSYDQFIQHFKNGEVFEKFDEHFLQEISLYVDDMRILKNIYNEFMIYNSRISTTEQDYNKLLAIIVYKNIFPRDFSDTQNNIGFVSTLLNSKEQIIEGEIKKINREIQEIEEKIEACDKEHLKNIDEVGMIYWTSNGYGSRIPNTNNSNYINRKEIVDLINSNQVKNLKDKIKQLETVRLQLKNKRINELINRENVNDVFSINYKNFLNEENNFNEIKSSQYFGLIRYLIRNGHIDETYRDYITYFYPNSLTTNDKMFLRSVTDKVSKEWTYKIDNPKLVLSRLREIDFLEIEVLNFSLFDYILVDEKKYGKYLINLVEQIRNNKYFKFIQQYFCYTNNLVPYVISINRHWSTFFKEIVNVSEFTYEQKKYYIILTLCYSERKIIDDINQNNILVEAISSDSHFLDVKDEYVDTLKKELLRIGAKFESINYEKSHKDLFEAVYQYKLYELTFENISLMLKSIYNVSSENDIIHKNYSLFYEDKSSKLYEYVVEHISEYISLVLNNCEGKITDTPKAAIELINSEDISIPKRTLYIQCLETKLEVLKEISEPKLWDSILKERVVKYSEENILYYFFKNENQLNETLVNFINENDKYLEFSKKEIDSIFGENSAASLFGEVIVCDTISDKKYENILAELRYSYSNFDIKEISETKMKILIDLEVIKMTVENVKFMRNNYQSKLTYFITKNINEYIDNIMDKQSLSNEELINILDIDLEDGLKTRLISNSNDSIPIISKKYSDDVIKYILQHNFDQSELSHFIKNYEIQTDNIKEVIREMSVSYIDTYLEEDIKLPLDLFKFLIKEEDISIENKLMLLVANMDSFSKVQCEDFMKIIGSKEHEKILIGGRPKFDVNEINEVILDKFKDRRWISDFYEENGVYKISRRKLHGI
ncbi:YobI family P-loop NTPase [Clostridium sp. 'White wine YQ']|uniref:YobI family P-loop NTPase n=1 Tax=Clostridium sp. 'White wine YQ' TaxID=3027474 RepID=UPI002365F1F1|nr:hypothetical protein [Clostridium sp. 'White wine YQ']MDD7794124.1 hypothetical protein [Clostridium sp. 'White wine YQ']